MDREYILWNIYKLTRIIFRFFDLKGSLLETPLSELEDEDPLCRDQNLFQRLLDGFEMNKKQGYVFFDNDFYYIAMKIETDILVAGPVSMERKSIYEIRRYLEHHNSKNNTFPVFMFRLKDMMELCAFVLGVLTHTTAKTGELFSEEDVSHALERDMTEYKLENSENNIFHYTYAMEQEMYYYFERGRYKEYEQLGKAERFSMESVGKLADKNEKQYEYMCVCTITLLTRSAIRAGVLATKAYEISDIILQQLSQAKNALEMSYILERGIDKLDEEICAVLDDNGINIYVEKSKDYIAKHIYNKIQLDDIADEIHLNPSYLSRIFKKNTGMNISQYIMKEKVMVSCNLLKYSDISISGIAEYVNLKPQSYFTKVFKQIQGVSPGKYRLEQKKQLKVW